MKKRRLTAAISAAAMLTTMLVPLNVSYAAQTTLTVGADEDYKTISAAVAKAKEINPQNETERVTIQVDPGNYEEQVMIEGMKYLTLEQTPGTKDDGRVNLYWYYCTGYCAGDCGLDGRYDPKINWSDPRTWSGYKEGDKQLPEYRLGQKMEKGSTISYYDTDGVLHENVKVQKDHLGDFTDQAALFINGSSSDIVVKDFNIVNAVPVMVTEGEKRVGVVPQEDRNADNATTYVLPHRDNLAVCDENTPMNGTDRVKAALAIKDDVQKTKALEALTDLTPEESAYLVRSDKYNERGHAISANGDRITFEGIRLRGNQDSLYISSGRMYFKDCDLIGGTDYIYGNATAVFDNCKLGAEGMSNKDYGATITAANHDADNPYGYLFYNCEIYNLLDNITSSNYGRPWRQESQITFYNTLLDDTAATGASKVSIDAEGWHDMSNNKKELARFYEYGTKNRSGAAIDLSKRVKNENGFGTVLDNWQILEFNPRNYYNSAYWLDTKKKSEWDPMNFAAKLENVDAQMSKATVNVPEGEATTITLPVSSDKNIEFKWESASANAKVSADGKTIKVIRPAAGEAPIETTVTLYAMDKTTGLGDKKEIPVTIAATTDKENVFSMPVTLTQSAKADNKYTVTLTKDGALVKSQVIEVTDTTATATIENIPVTDGEYELSVVSESDEFTVMTPTDGKMNVKGSKGEEIPLTIISQKLVDDSVKLDISTTPADGKKSYDLIAMAKAAGATEIDKSDSVKVSFDVTVNAKPAKNGVIDLSAGTPSNAGAATADRYTALKVNSSWIQLDAVDCSQGWSGSSNTPGQCLNITGKFTYPSTHTVTATIDYKTNTVSIGGSNVSGGSYSFENFPVTGEKGKLVMGVFPGNSTDDYKISGVKLTYKRLVTGEEKPEEIPEGSGVYAYPGNRTYFTGGNQAADTNTYEFVDGADETAKKLFADETDASKVKADYTKDYLNYISGTASNGVHPGIKLDIPAGKYKLYYVGYNSDVSTKTATINNKTFTLSEGKDFAKSAAKTLKLYTADIEVSSKDSGETLVFDASSSWLPDLYAVVIAGTKEIGVVPTATPTTKPTTAPTATPTVKPTVAPTATPTATPTEPMIVSAIKADGKTTVNTLNIKNASAVAAKYGKDGRLEAVKTAAVNGDTTVIEGIEADKIMIMDSMSGMKPMCEAKAATVPTVAPTLTPTIAPTEKPDFSNGITVDFTNMKEVPVYSAEKGQGFVSVSDAIMPEKYRRQTAPTSEIKISSDGASVTESTGSYLKKASDNDNFGGLIYRIDTGKAGAYHLEVEVTGSSADTQIAPTGMQASRLTSTANWDTAGLVSRTSYATWNENVWSYDFATGESFVEIEIEPKTLATAAAPQTVGVKKITVTPIDMAEAGDKPTIHILGDSTQKTYTFNETISAWGQTMVNFFDTDKINVINYSMGGRAMKSNYNEGRFNEVLMRGKPGDYVFLHSAHNDETVSNERFTRGAATSDSLEENNANQNRWFDMYIEAIKARGMTPVLVTAMPRISGGRVNLTDKKPNGFNPDSPGNMRKQAAADPDVVLAELFDGAVEYINKLDAKEVEYIYNNFEAGETPANNSANGTNGDGTHYREAASKQWCRIILQSLYDQSVAAEDVYTDKAKAAEIMSYAKDEVQNAAKTGDWSEVFPEMAKDVSAVDVVPGAVKQEQSAYYYRNNIEKALQLGALHKDTDGNFKPNETITVGEFARGMEKVFGLEANSLDSYTKTYAELTQKSSLAGEDVVELNEGEFVVTVDQSEGGEITIYNESEFNTETANVPSGVTAGKVIADNDYFTFTAPSEIVQKSDSQGAGMATGITGDYIETRNNGTKQPKFTAKADGIFTAYLMFVDHKLITLENKTDGTKATKYINNTTTAGDTKANQYNAVTFEVKAGNEYEFYTNGGTGRLFGIKYESSDYPQSTTSMAVSNGDEIRVVARPNDGYMNGMIIVDGADKANTKEYKFTVTGNTTVSASFIAEPSMVEKTVIASDAALTREAMGAIMYDAYLMKYGKNESGAWNKVQYMNQNGNVPSPDDPDYDPNIKYEGSPYIPLTGWGALEDLNRLDESLYGKVKEAYNLGLMRSEQNIARGSISCGSVLEPKAEVTRAKAAKALVFAFILTQPTNGENQSIPEGFAVQEPSEIVLPNRSVPTSVIK